MFCISQRVRQLRSQRKAKPPPPPPLPGTKEIGTDVGDCGIGCRLSAGLNACMHACMLVSVMIIQVKYHDEWYLTSIGK